MDNVKLDDLKQKLLSQISEKGGADAAKVLLQIDREEQEVRLRKELFGV